MTLHRSARRAIAAAFALTLVVAACGGDDDSSDDPPETTADTTAPDKSTTTTGDEEPTDSSEPEEEGPDAEEAQALAESINLTLDDFADGWQESAAEEDDDELSECFQDVDIDEVEVAQADSPSFSFTHEDGERAQFVQSTTIVVDEAASGEAVIAEIGTDQFAGCAEDALIAAVEEDGGTIESGGLEPIEDQAGRGDEGVALAGDIVIVGADGSEAQGQLAYYFIRTGNVVTGVSILDIGDLAFQETLTELLDVVVERQAANV
jgi:hypothetical protein